MFDKSDPRKSLDAYEAPTGPFALPQFAEFDGQPAVEQGDEWKAWYIRSGNLVLRYVEVDGTARFSRDGQIDEYMVFSLDEAVGLSVSTEAGESATQTGAHLFVVPPGQSQVEITGTGSVTFLFTTRAEELVAKCPNAEAYDDTPSLLPPFQPWPDPPAGFVLRHYALDVPMEEGRFGRLFRCTTMMVNVLYPQIGPRDTSRVSPHFHNSFEQISLTLDGEFEHHLRWPRTSDKAHWIEDQVVRCGSPSVLVIPPPSIHTTLWTGAGSNQIVDIFSPPRMDFSCREGWVLNHDDYPVARTEIE
ncbi:cupin domain-containing protein [Chachezhania sediminis]|uniref:hypothetical protein n=1 Tax=Chachezhania sediminis TaxID=2599291 RepID=UPI00131D4F85|nr:hypothetical protein [Chachezhania sediminis]